MDKIMAAIQALDDLNNRPMPAIQMYRIVLLARKAKLMEELNRLTNGDGAEYYACFRNGQ